MVWCAPVARVFFNHFLRFFSFFSFFCGWLDWRELRAFISSPLWDSRKNEDVPHEVEFSEEEHVDIQRPVIKSAQQEQRAAVHRGHTHAVCCSCLASSVDKGLSPGCCFETSYCRQRRGRGGEGLGALLTTAGSTRGKPEIQWGWDAAAMFLPLLCLFLAFWRVLFFGASECVVAAFAWFVLAAEVPSTTWARFMIM